MQPLFAADDRYVVKSGLDFWFTPAGASIKVPTRWKQFVITWSVILSLLAHVETQAGGAKLGLDLLTNALDRVRETGERWFEAELHRLTGELMLQLPAFDRAEVEARLRHAAELARGQSAAGVNWKSRAASKLGAVLRYWSPRND